MSTAKSRAWIELDAGALRHNLAQLRRLLPEGCTLLAVVKANAYGHGAAECAALCQENGVDAFAVASAAEGAALRESGIEGAILVLGYSGAEAVPLLSRYRLSQAVVSLDHARLLNACGLPLQVHWKVDTGLHRLGFPWDRPDMLTSAFACRNLHVRGLFTHLSDAEALDPESRRRTRRQIDRFFQTAEHLRAAGCDPGTLHLQGSYGLLNYGGIPGCGWVRAGIALYGLLSSPEDVTRCPADLRPVLSLRARVAQVHTLPAGETAGYDGAFLARRPSRLALVTIGYADGWPRSLSRGRGRVLVRGQYAPIAGLICMDQLLIDVTDIPEVSPGDVVTLIGRDGDACLTAGEAAQAADTITNELLSRLGARLERVVTGRSGPEPLPQNPWLDFNFDNTAAVRYNGS